ncbi:MAG: RNA polymerase sigma factor [Opitutaceae bacterium]|nr:RNA polymerase sigma factor [Opitutaceae bacterium]
MGANDLPTDAACLQALQEDEVGVLDQLMARWQRPLYEFAYQYLRNHSDAQELVAESFVRLYQHRHRLRPDTSLSGWLFTTLSNLCCNHYRWRRRHPTVSLDATAGDAVSPVPSLSDRPELEPGRRLEKDEALTALDAALENLPHDLKVTLLLHHYNKMPYEEIAAVVNCSTRGVETRLYRARQKLRETLDRYLRDGDRPASAVGRETTP